MLLGRLLIGITNGAGVMIYPLYLVEIAPESKKSMFGASFQLGLNIGVSISLFIGLEWIGGTVTRWPWALATQVLPNLLHLISLYFAVESPIWLEIAGRTEEADLASLQLYGYVRQSEHKKEARISNGKKSDDFWKSYWTKFKTVFSDEKIRNPLMICLVFRVLQMSNGVVSVQVFSLSILQSAGVDTSVATVAGLCISLTSIFASILGLKIMKSKGIRKSYLFSSAGAFVAMSTFFVMNFFVEESEIIAYLSIGALTLYVIFSNFGMMPIPFMLPALWVPIEYKSVITGIMVFVGLLVIFPLNLVLPYLLYEIDNYTFLIFTTSIGLSFCYGYFKMAN